MSDKEKYYKYKTKYLDLKNQLGGEIWQGKWDKNVWTGKYTETDDFTKIKTLGPLKGLYIPEERNILLIKLTEFKKSDGTTLINKIKEYQLYQ